MTRYKNGVKLEYAVQDDLEQNGYWTMRAPGSRGTVDVIGLKRGHTVIIQCKKTDPYLPPASRDALVAIAAQVGAIPVSAYFHKEGRAARQVRYLLVVAGTTPRTWPGWTPDYELDFQRRRR